MKLQFKFATGVKQSGRQHLIEELAKRGAHRVRPLFPGECDPELASLFIADVKDEKTGSEMLKYLQSSKVIEFAEPEVRRKLIR